MTRFIQTSLASRLPVKLDYSFLRSEFLKAAHTKWYVMLLDERNSTDFEFGAICARQLSKINKRPAPHARLTLLCKVQVILGHIIEV